MLQGLLIHDAAHHLAAEAEMLRGHETFDIFLESLVFCPTHYFFSRFVQRGDSSFQIEGEEDVLGVLKQVMESLFALAGRAFCSLAFNGVPESPLEQVCAESFFYEVFIGAV